MYRIGNNILTINNQFFNTGTETPFSPASLSGLSAWYGDTMNGVDRSTLSDATTITTWDDLYSGGTDLTQINSSYVVTYDSTKDALKILGTTSNEYGLKRSTPVIAGTGDRTYFTVVYPVTTPSDYMQPAYYEDGAGVGGGTIARDYNSFRYFNGNIIWGTSVGTGAWKLITDVFTTNYGSSTSRINGSDLSFSSKGNPTGTWNVSGQFSIMNGYFQSIYQKFASECYHREFIAYDRALSSTEVGLVEKFLNDKYSIY